MGIALWTVFAACLFTTAVAEVADQEYGNYSVWRKVVCERNSEELLDDLDECYQKEPEMILKAFYGCYIYADPESEGNVRHFENAACNDLSLFRKFDECYAKYESDPEFRKKAELDQETLDCYKAVIDKHQLDELLSYFEKSPDENK